MSPAKYPSKSVFSLFLEVLEQDRHVYIASTNHAAYLFPLKTIILKHCRYHCR